VYVTPKQLKEIETDISKMRLITPSLISDKYKITSSVAKKVIKYFSASGKILPLDAQSK